MKSISRPSGIKFCRCAISCPVGMKLATAPPPCSNGCGVMVPIAVAPAPSGANAIVPKSVSSPQKRSFFFLVHHDQLVGAPCAGVVWRGDTLHSRRHKFGPYPTGKHFRTPNSTGNGSSVHCCTRRECYFKVLGKNYHQISTKLEQHFLREKATTQWHFSPLTDGARTENRPVVPGVHAR